MNHQLIKILFVFGLVLIFAACSALKATVKISSNASPQGSQKTASELAVNGYGIIGGTEVAPGDDLGRNVAALQNVARGTLCSASIIASDILITAAHCVNNATPSELRVVFGLDIDSPNRTVVPVINAIQSPIFTDRQMEVTDHGDLALVRISGKIPVGYAPAQILTDESLLQDGGTVLLAGYGITNGVTKVGAGVLRQTNALLSKAQFGQTEVLLDQSNGHGSCHGDSGGPAYLVVGGRRLLFGVDSRGVNDTNNDCTKFVAFTRIMPFSSWLNSAVKSLRAAAVQSNP